MTRKTAPQIGHTFQRIAEAQRQWARRNGIAFTSNCRVAIPEANLFQPLHAETLREFCSADGRELEDKFLALYSSAALATNFFDHWRRRPAVVGAALDAADTRMLCFERKHPLFDGIVPRYQSGPTRKCPNVDVEMAGSTCTLVFECKFTEPFVHFFARYPPFTSTYFATDALPLWTGLASTRDLALRLQSGAAIFPSLGAAQLIKTALACRRAFGAGKWRFVHLWYELQIDAECETEARAYREELARFLAETRGEIPIEPLSWAELFGRFATLPEIRKDPWAEWMRARYFNLE